MVSLFCPPLSLRIPNLICFFACTLTLTTFTLSLSFTLTQTHSLSVKLVFTLLMFSLCSHYGLNPLPSLASFLCSFSWRLQLCSSLLLAFLVRYRYSFSTLFEFPPLYVHISTFLKMSCLVFLSLLNNAVFFLGNYTECISHPVGEKPSYQSFWKLNITDVMNFCRL